MSLPSLDTERIVHSQHSANLFINTALQRGVETVPIKKPFKRFPLCCARKHRAEAPVLMLFPAFVGFQLVESKLDRNSNFETPVAVFVLQFELYVVTGGFTVGSIEQSESINNAFVDGVFSYLTIVITEIEISFCRRGCPRGCTVFLGKD